MHVEGRDGPANHERLCVKGRFGFDYVSHPHRLTKPLIRKPGFPKSADFTVDPAESAVGLPRSDLGRGAGIGRRRARAHPRHARPRRARRIRLGQGQQRGGVSVPEARPHRLSGRTTSTTARGSATRRASRRCSKASARARCPIPVMDVMQAEVVLLIGANPVSNHPVAATWIKNAVKNGTKLILADPRRSELARHADALPAVQAGQRRRDAERDDAHDRRGRSRRASRSSTTARAATRSCATTSRATAPKRWRRCAASTRQTLREVARHVRDVARRR